MTRFIIVLALASFAFAAEARSSKGCTDWCTNKSTGQKFRVR